MYFAIIPLLRLLKFHDETKTQSFSYLFEKEKENKNVSYEKKKKKQKYFITCSSVNKLYV